MIAARLKPASAKTLFEPAKPLRLMDRASLRVMYKWGGYARRVARNSIKKRKSAAQPGQPPSRVNDVLRGNIFFAVDQVNRTVIAGPQQVPSLDNNTPRLLEEGGTAVRQFWLVDDQGLYHTPGDVPSWAGQIVGAVHSQGAPRTRVQYDAHPYMGPAADAANQQVDRWWRESVK